MAKTRVKVGATVGTYVGTHHRWLTGTQVRIVRVIRGHQRDPDNAEMVVHGTIMVGPADILEVQSWSEKQKRWSWVTSDVTIDEIDFDQTRRPHRSEEWQGKEKSNAPQ